MIGTNDAHGHQAGDACLVRVAEALRIATRRPSDIVGRYGGNEFVALLPDTDSGGAASVLENVRVHLDIANIYWEERPEITMSVGIASCNPNAGCNPEDPIQSADAKPYSAKRSGRNRIQSGEMAIAS